MFLEKTEGYNYGSAIHTVPTGQNIYCPIEKDTEFTHPPFDINNPSGQLCKNLTVQCRSIYHEQGLIYAHTDNRKDARHKVFLHEFAVLDYLEDMGLTTDLTHLASWNTRTDLPWIQYDIYSFLAVAELMRIFLGRCRADVLSLVTRPTTYGIVQARRLRTFTKAGGKNFDWVEMPWVQRINGIGHRVRLCIYDTGAVQGNGGYANFCANSGVILQYKNNFTPKEKASMDKMYIERPQEFDNYALGDLRNYEALMGHQENFKNIYKTLGLEKYFEPPRFTTGATIARLFSAAIKKLFNADAEDKNQVVNNYCKYASADYIKRMTTTTACLNAKVDGGRCRNNRPLDTVLEGVLCNLDIDSCYGEGLRVQTYPVGRPFIIDYPIDSELNNYQSLREFLKKYKKELYPGLWQARVSTKKDYLLQTSQDYLTSWYPPKDMTNLPTDEDFVSTDEWWTVDNVGEMKILTNEIQHAIITHDFVQWLDNVASQKQKRELLDNLFVDTAAFYPASRKVNSIAELIEKRQQHKGKNTCEVVITKNQDDKISISRECHYWYGINIGDLIVNQLLLERKKHLDKTPFNVLYKLCVNTLYGDMVSPFFKVGNVIVGNNITARARGLAWIMEKGLHGGKTITDGCDLDLNRVLHPANNRRITGENVVNIYTIKDHCNHKYAPLKSNDCLSVTDNYNTIELRDIDGKPGLVFIGDDTTQLSPEDSLRWVNQATWKYLQNMFLGLDILHQETTNVYGRSRSGQFEFKAKGIYDTLISHGTANYIEGYDSKWEAKMRSYSKSEQTVITFEDGKLVEDHPESVAKNFLLALRNPTSVERSKVYIKEKILKCGDFKRNYRKWENSEVYPGISLKSAGLLREFSLSQFTFRTQKQYLSWRKQYEGYLKDFDQSYEMFFLNVDGTLNYQAMIENVDEKIRSGKQDFFDGLSRSQKDVYRAMYQKHPESETLRLTRKKLDDYYLGESQ